MGVSIERLQKVLEAWPGQAAVVLRQEPAARLARRLAEELAGLLGKGVTVGCRLGEHLALLGGTGKRWTEAEEELAQRLSRANPGSPRLKLRLPNKRLAWTFRLGSGEAVAGHLVLAGPPRHQALLVLFGIAAAQALSCLLQRENQAGRQPEARKDH